MTYVDAVWRCSWV